MAKLAPSILTCNFTKLHEAIAQIDNCGCHAIHCDVMDGIFVPPITFGAKMIADFRKITDTFLDIHCMVQHPQTKIESFLQSGADRITFHIEAEKAPEKVLKEIQAGGANAGLAISPKTEIEMILPYLDKLETVLVMTVTPGYGGQVFLLHTLEKIRILDSYRKEHNLPFEIEVDGGINLETAKLCVDAGADILVCGSAFFTAKNQQEFAKSIFALQHENKTYLQK